jgi:predicted nucleic acid-binding protein
MSDGNSPTLRSLRIVLDVNILVSKLNADLAGKSGTISQKAVALVIGDQTEGNRIQIIVSYPMIDTYRTVLLSKGKEPALIDEAAEAWIGMMKYGPDELDPMLILGGTPDLTLKDAEDGGVLATAFGAKADILVNDNLKDFAVGNCDIFETSIVRRPDGKTRQLTCQLHSRTDGSCLLVAHPADFVQWMERRFDMSPTSIRLAY